MAYNSLKKMSPKTLEKRNKMSFIPHILVVGSIIYAILYTRPDVAYALGIVSRFQTDLEEDHWKAVKNILKYLRRTKNIFLIYDGSDLKLKDYTDFSFQSNLDDSKSIFEYVFTLYGGAVN